jgi:hypothetical protein
MIITIKETTNIQFLIPISVYLSVIVICFLAERERDYIVRCVFVARRKLKTLCHTTDDAFFDEMSGDFALQLCDEIKKSSLNPLHRPSSPDDNHNPQMKYTTTTDIKISNINQKDATMKCNRSLIDIESLRSNIPIAVKSNKFKDRLKRAFHLRFQNPSHEQEFENWYTQQQLHSYAMIAIYVIFFSCWHAFWDINTFCDGKLEFRSPSLCLDTPTGQTILIFRVAYFAGIPLIGLGFGMLKCVPVKIKEMVAIVLIGLYTYGHIYWATYISLLNSLDNTRVRQNCIFDDYGLLNPAAIMQSCYFFYMLEYLSRGLLHRRYHVSESIQDTS